MIHGLVRKLLITMPAKAGNKIERPDHTYHHLLLVVGAGARDIAD